MVKNFFETLLLWEMIEIELQHITTKKRNFF